MKKTILIIFFIIGCAKNSVVNFTSSFIDTFLLDNDCKSIIYRYNNLKKEQKNIITEYEKFYLSNSISDQTIKYYEERILDLSFQIDDEYMNLVICNGGKTIY